MSLIDELDAAVRVEAVGPDFVGRNGSERRLLVNFIITGKGSLEGLAVNYDVVV